MMSLPSFDHAFNVQELQAVVHALDKGRTDGVFIIDAREDFEVAAVPPLRHALVIPIRDIERALKMWGSEFQKKYNARKPAKKDRIVVYALNGRRAMSAAAMLEGLGYKHTVCLASTLMEYLEQTQNEVDDDL
jgi:rhodanese-related sulfurtransferase